MKYRKEIDGLRALAILPVILFHADFSLFSGGYVGVDVFFVISGYLITTLLLNEMEEGSFSLINFYIKRVRRILPALFFVMLFTLLFAWLWMMPNELTGFSKSVVAIPYFISNINFWMESGYFDLASEFKPLIHTWSLAVEEQYNFIFPIFLSAVWMFGKKKIIAYLIILFTLSLVLAQWCSYAHPSFNFYLLPTRSFELLSGAILALLINLKAIERNQQCSQFLSFVGLVLVIYSIFVFNSQTPFPSLYTLVPIIGTCLIIGYANYNNIVGRILGLKVFVGIGLISYSTYLWHQPLLAFARLRILGVLENSYILLICFLSLVLGYLTWKYIETPFRDKKIINIRQLIVAIGIMITLFTSFGIGGYLSDGFSFRIDQNLLKIYETKKIDNNYKVGCHRGGDTYSYLDESCIYGIKQNINVALIGDSHADSLAFELGEEALKKGVGIVQFTFNSCPPIKNIYIADVSAKDKCTKFNNEVENYINSNSAIEYIIIASRWTRFIKNSGFDNGEGGIEYSKVKIDIVGEDGERQQNTDLQRIDLIKRKYIEMVSKYLKMGKKVILVYPIPEVGWSAPDYFIKQKLFYNKNINASTGYSKFLSRNNEAIDTLNQIPSNSSLIRIYPDKILCNSFAKDRCIFVLNDKVLYVDNNHLSSEGAKLIVPEIFKYIN